MSKVTMSLRLPKDVIRKYRRAAKLAGTDLDTALSVVMALYVVASGSGTKKARRL